MKRSLYNDINREIRMINEGFSFGNEKMMRPKQSIPSIRTENNIAKEENGDDILDRDIESSTTDFDKTIASMRRIALKGLLTFGDNTISDEYVFFKKIVTDCDNQCSKKIKKNTPEI